MSKRYNQYIMVDNDFIPVFSGFKDQEFPNRWKSFYAHESFKTIISQLLDTLEKGNKDKDLPLWMYGAYGTGKTYASFVVKHLLEDHLNDIKSYCDSNNMTNIYSKIAGIRKDKKILVVHRSASSGIIGNNRLYNCIIESMKNSLKKNGYTYFGEKSQYDNVLSMLNDTNSSFDFTKAFEKYRLKFDGYDSAQSVVKDLEELGIDDSIDLLETIIEVAELEHYMISTSTNDVINWIEDVIKGNGIYATVFIWDEFTEFFKNNQNNITGLQEIAMASSRINFYLFLITHSGSQIIADQSAKKIIEARFKIHSIDLADTTAFRLMGKAIKHDTDLINEWFKVVNELWSQVERITQSTIIQKSEDMSIDDFKQLLPIHPYAAFLLKVISKEISSNQRTMFQFLSGDYVEGNYEKHNFKWFIDHHTSDIDNWSYLTSDYIWDYFFTDENVDLNEAYKSAIAQYNNYAHFYNDDEPKLRVLKVALLLSAIQQKSISNRTQGQSTLLKATLNNISLAFVGTKIHSMVSSIMNLFVTKGIFSTIQEGNDTLFIPPVQNIDQERYDKIYEEFKKILTFEKILTDPLCKIDEQFVPTDYLKYRYTFYKISIRNYKNLISEANSLADNQIPVFFLYAINEIDQTKIQDTILKITNLMTRKFLIFDFSSTPLTDAAYDKYLRSKTEERYYGIINDHGKMANQNASNIIKEWKQKLIITTISIHQIVNDQPNQIQGCSNLHKKLKEFNSIIFGCGLEEITINDKVFEPKGFKEAVAQMGMDRLVIPNNYNYLKNISNRLVIDNIWNNENYMLNYPNHPVTKMKKQVDEIVSSSFEKNSMVAITDIWDSLQKPPFGLLSCTGTVFIMGFLLQEYGNGNYYKFDGVNTISLNHTDLSDLIFSVVKENAKAKNQSIVKQKPEHIEFCQITGGIFKIAKDKQNSIQDIIKNINIFLKNNEYPLWTLASYITLELEDEPLQQQFLNAIKLYCELISNNFVAGRDATLIAEELYNLYKNYAGLDTKLEEIICIENMKTGMLYYIASYNPSLIQIKNRLNISDQELLANFNKQLSGDASYLWDKKDTDHQIDNIYDDYKLLDAVNEILSDKKNNFSEIVISIKKKLSLIKIPREILVEQKNEIKEIVFGLYSIIKNDLKNKKVIIDNISNGAEAFNSFFINQFSVFELIVRQVVDEPTIDEIEYLYDNIEQNIIDKSSEEYKIKLNTILNTYRKNKKTNMLLALWKSKTNTSSPEEWSRINRVCILCLFENNYMRARDTFEFINKTRQVYKESEIDDAIKFLNSSEIDKLSDIGLCTKIMVESFSGEYSYIIDDFEEFKNRLLVNLGNDVYNWIINKNGIKECVNSYVQLKYKTTYKFKVIEKIEHLTPEDAKRFLIQLIEDKPMVGINILKK